MGHKRGIARIVCAGIVAALAVLTGTQGAAAAGSYGNAGVLPPGSASYGKTYGQWSIAWWQWFLGTPVHGPQGQVFQPLAPDGSVDCSYGQSGHVWFLTGTFASSGTAHRSCAIPSGTALFLPVADDFCTEYPTYDCRQQDHITQFVNGITSMAVAVDGRPLSSIGTPQSPYRVPLAQPFVMRIPTDNLYGIPDYAGTYPDTWADGVYVLLAPLSVGTHVLHWTAAAPGFTQDITYTVKVVPGR